MLDELRDHGRALAQSLGLPRDAGTSMAELLARQYARWPRRYHDARHLLHCVREAEALRPQVPDVDAIAFALWFHDAVYKPWRHDNERRSADQARAAALTLGLGASTARRISATGSKPRRGATFSSRCSAC